MDGFLFLMFVSSIVSMFIFGIICGNIANRKGHNESRYFWIGFFFGVFGLCIVLLINDK
jgi:hypothetical protein